MQIKMNCQILLCLFSLLFSLQTHADLSNIKRIYHQTPQLDNFEICQGGGCLTAIQTNLSTKEWQSVAQIFNPTSKSAEQERVRIATAVGLLERMIGKKTGTSDDMAGTFGNSEHTGQQDCNDEAMNTTTYLRLLQQNGLLTFYIVGDMRTRNFFFSGWPHSTASIKERASSKYYAVDSWFFDNGHDATVVPLDQWKDNFYPDDSPVNPANNKKSK
jgi:hypothetical protein